MGPIQELANELGAEERTLRRATAQGTLRARRTRPRRLQLAPGEREYLRTHWHLLAELRGILRTQREVRLAVLYGSVARGDEDDDSDFDLLVSFAPGRAPADSDVADRVAEIVNRRVDLADLWRVESGAPLLLDRVLDEGRVLVDRDGHWAELQQRRIAIRARARRAYRRQLAGASLAIEELTR